MTIPAGATQAVLKIKAINNNQPDSPRTIKLKLVAPPDGSYTVGSTPVGKVQVLDGN